MPNTKPGSSENKALAALHDDLQEGKGGWKAGFASLGTGETGNTTVDVQNQNNAYLINITGVEGSTFDAGKLSQMSLGQYTATIATEGGIYESASGRAGPAVKSEFTQAMFDDYGMMDRNDPKSASDWHEDQVTNKYFNLPLCVDLDR